MFAPGDTIRAAVDYTTVDRWPAPKVHAGEDYEVLEAHGDSAVLVRVPVPDLDIAPMQFVPVTVFYESPVIPLESCVCGSCTGCPDGYHQEPNCICTADCAYEENDDD